MILYKVERMSFEVKLILHRRGYQKNLFRRIFFSFFETRYSGFIFIVIICFPTRTLHRRRSCYWIIYYFRLELIWLIFRA